MILDVGCGNHPKGDINVDLYRITHEQTQWEEIKTLADIIAAGEYLPFKDKVFNQVRSSHVIEHAHDPRLFIKESVRVSNDEIYIKCPTRWVEKWKMHRNYITRTWLADSFQKLGCKIIHSETGYGFKRIWRLPFYIVRHDEVTIIAKRK